MNKDKIIGLTIGDIHWGAMDPNRLYNELDEVFINHVKELGNDLDIVVIAGDYFDKKLSLNSKSSILALQFMNDLLNLSNEYDFKVRMILGTKTHDLNQLDNFKSYEVSGEYDFKIFNSVTVESFNPNITILYVPEEYIMNQKEYYKPYIENLDENIKYDLMFFHGTFDFMAFSNQRIDSERHIHNAPVFNSKEWKEYVWGPIMGGHIHTGDSIYDKIFYTSSFTRWSYGESGDKGFLQFEYDVNTTEYSVTKIVNGLAPEFKTYKVTDLMEENDSIESVIETIKELQKDENVRIQFNADSKDSDINIIREYFHSDKSVKLDVREKIQAKDIEDQRDKRYDFILNKEYDVPTTVMKYIQLKHGKDIPLDKITSILLEEEV